MQPIPIWMSAVKIHCGLGSKKIFHSTIYNRKCAMVFFPPLAVGKWTNGGAMSNADKTVFPQLTKVRTAEYSWQRPWINLLLILKPSSKVQESPFGSFESTLAKNLNTSPDPGDASWWSAGIPFWLLKGTVSRDFLLLVFFINQFTPSPRVSK